MTASVTNNAAGMRGGSTSLRKKLSAASNTTPNSQAANTTAEPMIHSRCLALSPGRPRTPM